MADLSIYVDGRYYGRALASARQVAMHSDHGDYTLRGACRRFGFPGLQSLLETLTDAYASRSEPDYHAPHELTRAAAGGKDPNELRVSVRDDNKY